MHLGRGHVGQLRAPRLDVGAVLVVVKPLLQNVELVHAAARQTRRRHPVPPVGVHIVVQEQALEVVRSIAPVKGEVQRQIRRHILAAAVGHEARVLQLAHVRIYKRISCVSILPQLQHFGVIDPWLLHVLWALQFEHISANLLAEKTIEVAPEKLEHDPVRGLVLFALLFVFLQLPVDGAWGDAAVRQPRGQFGGIVAPEHAVARVKVGGHQVRVPQVVLQASQRH
mmetsp:Transcript_12667/g.21465  ORF Transcript_12667/g.21465 Transcript_12667/m.21465 type:complete len:226 (-) Transcript_12667:566-1243(-)